MKVLVNNQYGGFHIKDEIVEKIWGKERALFIDEDEMRVNAELIAMKERGEDIEDNCCDLIIVNVPENATDWMVTEYDGLESLYMVVDGKIV